MSAIRSINNATELRLRQLLHAKGLRFRKYSKAIPGRPDIVFPRAKVAVFVDGDYWHGRVLREKGEKVFVKSLRTANTHYWLSKMKRNIKRDDLVGKELSDLGWVVMRIWESDAKANLPGVATQVANRVRSRVRRLVRP